MCGREMPELMDAITDLTALFRELGLPIYYKPGAIIAIHPTRRGIWNLKLKGGREPRLYQGHACG